MHCVKWLRGLILGAGVGLSLLLGNQLASACPGRTATESTYVKKGDWVVEVRFKPVSLSSNEADVIWGTLRGDRKCDRVERISIKYRGKSIPVPPSAWSGLSRTRTFRADLDLLPRDRARLRITAGDAGTAYGGLIEFSRNGVTRRRVWLGEFPEDVYEETRYGNQPPDANKL